MNSNNAVATKTNPFFVNKGWGWEKWVVNKTEYCGKVLHVRCGKKTSWHYHAIKDEVMYAIKGSFIIKYSWDDDINSAQEVTIGPDESMHIPPFMRHQIIAPDEDSELIEFSTQHFDSDSHRLIKGD